MSREDQVALAKVRLEELLTYFGVNTRVQVEEDGDRVELLVDTDQSGQLIGHHGENLRAIQYLVNMMVRGQERLRFGVDIGGYKKARAEQMMAKATEFVQQVLDSGEDLTLPPMSAADRRIVHMVVGDTDGVISESAGFEPKRYVIIKLG